MDKWKKSIDDKVSDSFENRVLQSVRPLLKQNEELHAKSQKPIYLRWQFLAVPGLAVAVIVALSTLKSGQQAGDLSPEMDLIENFAMYKDLQEIENLELLQQLGEPEKWPTKAKAAKKSS